MIEPSTEDYSCAPLSVQSYIDALEDENDRLTNPWIKWSEARPDTTGTYLTYWSDGAVETFPIDARHLDSMTVTVSNAVLVCWAKTVAPPTAHFIEATR